MGPILLSGFRHYLQDNDRGAFAVGAPNDTVRELTGEEAEDFETIARRHAALPQSHQSFGARLRCLRALHDDAELPDGSVDSSQLAGLDQFHSS